MINYELIVFKEKQTQKELAQMVMECSRDSQGGSLASVYLPGLKTQMWLRGLSQSDVSYLSTGAIRLNG